MLIIYILSDSTSDKKQMHILFELNYFPRFINFQFFTYNDKDNYQPTKIILMYYDFVFTKNQYLKKIAIENFNYCFKIFN